MSKRINTVRGKKLRALGAPKGLETIGFRRALMRMVAEHLARRKAELSEFDDDEEEDPAKFIFTEWFGDAGIVPAGFTIERRNEGRGIWDYTVHVYEIESSAYVPLWKIGTYGRMADGDGPVFCLHIFDRFGRERVFDNDRLACLEWYCFALDRDDLNLTDEQRKECEDRLHELLNGAGSPDAALPKGERTRKWKAAYDALRELGVEV